MRSWPALLLPLISALRLQQNPYDLPDIDSGDEVWWEDWESEEYQEAESPGAKSRWYPYGWIKKRVPGYLAYFDVHIPKTAGTSWANDLLPLLPKGQGYHSKEVCFHSPGGFLNPGEQPGDFVPQRDRMVVMLRRPAAHVYSQFLECKFSNFGKLVVPPENRSLLSNITTWLRFFQGGKEEYDLMCYHPYNMQARALTCGSDEFFASHHYNQSHEPSLTAALDSVASAFFVGLVEHYQSSFCLFLAKAAGWLPAYCDCRDPEKWAKFKSLNETHHVPPHSLSDLSMHDLALIDDLTQKDQIVYLAALRRFVIETGEVHRRTGVQILCWP